MSEISNRVLDVTENGRPELHGDEAFKLAREVEALESQLALAEERRLTALGLGDLEREALEPTQHALRAAEAKLAKVKSYLRAEVVENSSRRSEYDVARRRVAERALAILEEMT